MADEPDNIEIAKICDRPIGFEEKRRLLSEHFRKTGNIQAVQVLEQVRETGLTADDEREATEQLGKSGVTRALSQRLLTIFQHNVNHDNSGGTLVDQNEVKLRRPGYVALTAEVAAAEGAQTAMGLNVDGTPNTVNPFGAYDPLAARSESADENTPPSGSRPGTPRLG